MGFPACSTAAAVALSLVATAVPAAPADSGAPSQQRATRLPEVPVEAEGPRDGSAQAGYKAETVKSLGPLGDKRLLDTPYSMTVMSSELIQNSIAGTPDQLYKMNPQTQHVRPSSYVFNAIVLRGIFSRFVLDNGMHGDAAEVYDVEALDSLQVLAGPTNFLYGATLPGGRVNYLYKEPTSERIRDITVGSYGRSSRFGHADLGGNLDGAGKFSYRLNAAMQDGDIAEDTDIEKGFVRAAVDWRITPDIVLQGYYAYSDFETTGNVMTWSLAAGATRPAAPAVDKNWAQPWTWTGTRTEKYGAKLTYAIAPNVLLRSAFQRRDRAYKGSLTVSNTINANGTYTTRYAAGSGQTYLAATGYAYLDFDTNILGAKAKFTVGYSGYDQLQKWGDNTLVTPAVLGTLPLGQRARYAKPVYSVTDDYPANDTRYDTWVIGGDFTLSERWSALLGLSYSDISTLAYSNNTRYGKGKESPTASIMYKPRNWLSTYASYTEALDKGNTAGNTYNNLPVTNRGEVKEPMTSKQVELGVKADTGRLLLSGALFQLEQAASRYLDNGNATYTFVQDGMTRYRGLELTVAGRLTDRLTLIGGITKLDGEVVKANAATTATPSLNGYRPWGMAEEMAKFYLEYDSPFLAGLTLTGGAYHTGNSYADNYERDKLAGYTLFDAGARYATTLGGYETTLRLNLTNLGNKSYWMWAAQNAATSPRTATFSVTTRF